MVWTNREERKSNSIHLKGLRKVTKAVSENKTPRPGFEAFPSKIQGRICKQNGAVIFKQYYFS
jgi:hypothetical protein